MTKQIIMLVLLMLFGIYSYAQRSNYSAPFGSADLSDMAYTGELGIELGATAFFGDLGGTGGKGKPFLKDFNSPATRPHFGISYSYYLQNWAKLAIAFNYTTISAADSLIKQLYNQSYGRHQRNLSFRSRIQELSLSAYIYPLQLLNNGRRETAIKPFIGVGVGVLHFNPQAQLNGYWVDLQPLHLEGEGFSEYPTSKNYKLYQLYIPFNVGFKYRVTDNFSIDLKAIFRKTFTDYLDDVSHHAYIDPTLFDKYLTPNNAALAKQLYYRGDPNKPINKGQLRSDNKNSDSYTTVAVTFAFRLGSQGRDADKLRW